MNISNKKNKLQENCNHILQPSTPIRLCSNENPNGPSLKTIRALNHSASSCCLYPNDDAPELMTKLASHCDVNKDQLLLGAGSTDIVEMMIRALSSKSRRVVIPNYCYTIYRNFTKAHQVDTLEVEMDDFASYPQNVIEAANSQDVGLVLIDNPNNPTGQYLSYNQLEYIMSNIPRSVPVVIDEAYFEYVTPFEDFKTAIPLLKEYDNLLVARTFSKAYGLASLRIGFAIAHPEMIARLKVFKRIFAVCAPAIAAATVAIEDRDYVKKTLDINSEGLHYLSNELTKMGIRFIRPSANYLCFYTSAKSKEIFSHIKQQGILIKDLQSYNMHDHLRVSIGSPHENKAFIEALKKAAHQHGLI